MQPVPIFSIMEITRLLPQICILVSTVTNWPNVYSHFSYYYIIKNWLVFVLDSWVGNSKSISQLVSVSVNNGGSLRPHPFFSSIDSRGDGERREKRGERQIISTRHSTWLVPSSCVLTDSFSYVP